MSVTLTTKIFIQRRERRTRISTTASAASTVPEGRIPRISRMMALAHRFDGLLRDGIVRDYADLAELAMVTQPRVTQIMNLLNLAPDLQETLLFLPRYVRGRAPVTLRELQSLTAETRWERQRTSWVGLGFPDRVDSPVQVSETCAGPTHPLDVVVQRD